MVRQGGHARVPEGQGGRAGICELTSFRPVLVGSSYGGNLRASGLVDLVVRSDCLFSLALTRGSGSRLYIHSDQRAFPDVLDDIHEINDVGQIVGTFSDATGIHGFHYSGGILHLDRRSASSAITQAEGINDSGQNRRSLRSSSSLSARLSGLWWAVQHNRRAPSRRVFYSGVRN